MPFTPFHFGPGAAIKAVAPRYFSFTIFCFAQVTTDCETAYYMLRGRYPWHRFFHTYIGATIMGFGCVLIGRPICQFALRLWRDWLAAPFKPYFPTSPTISMGSAFTGAFIGTYSHVLLDSIMHRDVAPFMPFSPANPFYRLVGEVALHASCILLGLLGAFLMARKDRPG
jgi:hypothetical protein